MDSTEYWHPGGQAVPVVHDRVVAHVLLGLHKVALVADPRRARPRLDEAGGRNATVRQDRADLVDRREARLADVGPIDAYDLAYHVANEEEVEAGRATQINWLAVAQPVVLLNGLE